MPNKLKKIWTRINKNIRDFIDSISFNSTHRRAYALGHRVGKEKLTESLLQELHAKAKTGTARDQAIFLAAKWNFYRFVGCPVQYKNSDTGALIIDNTLGPAYVMGESTPVVDLSLCNGFPIDKTHPHFT